MFLKRTFHVKMIFMIIWNYITCAEFIVFIMCINMFTNIICNMHKQLMKTKAIKNTRNDYPVRSTDLRLGDFNKSVENSLLLRCMFTEVITRWLPSLDPFFLNTTSFDELNREIPSQPRLPLVPTGNFSRDSFKCVWKNSQKMFNILGVHWKWGNHYRGCS